MVIKVTHINGFAQTFIGDQTIVENENEIRILGTTVKENERTCEMEEIDTTRIYLKSNVAKIDVWSTFEKFIDDLKDPYDRLQRDKAIMTKDELEAAYL